MPHHLRKLHIETKIHPHIDTGIALSQKHFYSNISFWCSTNDSIVFYICLYRSRIIIGTVKAKDNSKGLGLLILRLFSLLAERVHALSLQHTPPYKILPLTQSIMQAKTILNTHNTRYISQWGYHKHLILKYRPKQVVKTRLHGLRNILEKILWYAPRLFVSLAPSTFFINRTLHCSPHNTGILCWTMEAYVR